jgi:acyl-CoA thioesterase
MYARDRVAPGFGMVIDQVRPRYARIRMRVRDDMLNAHGICHGGIVFTLADCAFAYACNSENRSTLALGCTINFAAAARLGEELVAVAEASVQHSRIGVYDVTVTGGDGRTVAVFRGQSYRVGGETLAHMDGGAGDSSA